MTPKQIDRYQVLTLLGQGGMGEVYRAYDPDLDREVALKLITRSQQADPEEGERRFQREVRAAAQLRHPHIVTIYDVGLRHEPPFVVMELLTGQTLQAHLKQRPLPWPEAISLLQPVCQALAYAHRVGVVHRDLKPANIMFSDETTETLKLVDFGLAQLQRANKLTQTGHIMGSLAYMSPEQGRGERVDARTDIFTLGLILFEAITGRNPQDKGQPILTWQAVIMDDPVDLSPLATNTPAQLVKVIEGALAKNREARYRSAEALYQDLTACLAQAADLVRPSLNRLGMTETIAFSLGDGPVLENPAGISLPPDADAILKMMFAPYQRLVIRDEFGAEASASRTFLVRPIRSDNTAELPTIVKMAPLNLIRQEWQAYADCIQDKIPGVAEVKGQPALPPGSDWGGLRYSLMGGGDTFDLDIVSLGRYSSQAEVADLLFVLQEQLFKNMGPQWRFNQPSPEVLLRNNYDHVQPVNLIIRPELLPPDVSPHRLTSDTLSDGLPTVGAPVRLTDYVVTEIEADRQAVILNLPLVTNDWSASHRLRLQPVEDVEQYRVNQIVDSVEGYITATRLDLLRSEAQKALGQEFDLTDETVTLSAELTLPNPLATLPALLAEVHDVKVACIHGNLNLENILVDPSTREVNLIDFSNSRRDHVLHDLLCLETSIIVHLFPQALATANLAATTIYNFYVQLHQATFYADSQIEPYLPHSALAKPFEMLTAIRAEARKYLFNLDDPTEYYQGLIFYLLGALKFKRLDEVPQAKQVAFWGAATVNELLTLVGEYGEFFIPPCPYRGLEAFDIEHADFFFGRERLTRELVAKLSPTPGQENRFLAIIGPSGSGKSSLARAGLIAALKRGDIEGSADWLVAICQPGANPLESLAVALSDHLEQGHDPLIIDDLIQRFREKPTLLHLTTRLILRDLPAERRLVLLVDQFEEIFTLCHDEATRQAFLANLLYAAREASGQTVVLLTIRADFYGKCATYPDLAKALSEHQELVGPMTDDELRMAIERPAQQAGCQFEPGLVALLLRDVQNQPGSLPLLQYTLRELWDQQEKRRLTRAAYEALGRVDGALKQRAEVTYSHFSEAEQDICRRIFLRLTQPGEGTEDTKRRVLLAELLPAEGDFTAVEAVIQMLAGVEARLVTIKSGGELNGKEFVEVAHEALIRSWPRLQAWLDEDREAISIHRRLTEAAEEWSQHNQDDSYLYRGAQLATAEQWAQTYGDDMNPVEQAFLMASLGERERQAREQEAQRQRELAQAQALAKEAEARRQAETERAEAQEQAAASLRKRAVQLAVVSLVALLLAIAAGVFGVQSNQNAKEARNNAELAATRQAQAEAQRDETNRQRQISLAQGLSAQALRQYQAPLKQDELSALLARQAYFFDQRSQGRARDQVDNALRSVLSTPHFSYILPDHGGEVTAVAFSPDGQRLASGGCGQPAADAVGCNQGEILLRQIPGGQLVDQARADQTGLVLSVAFSPDGQTLASSSVDGTIILWALDQPNAAPVVLSGHEDEVTSVAFSPDGQILASGSRDKTVRLWDLGQSNAKPIVLAGHEAGVTSLAFSSDGQTLATGSEDKMVRLWNLGQPNAEPFILEGHKGNVTSVAFSPDSQTLASGSADKTVIVWDLGQPGADFIILEGHAGEITSVAFSPNGETLASSSEDKTLRLWDLGQAEVMPDILLGHQHWVTSVAFSPDGQTLASASRDQTVRLWDLHQFGLAPITLSGHKDEVTSVAFSSDGRWLASGSRDKTVGLWGLRQLEAEPVILRGHKGQVRSIAFSPDSQILASGGRDKTIRLWDLGQLEANPIVLRGHEGEVRSIAFSPDGQTLASGGLDKTIWLWDVSTGQPINQPLTDHKQGVTSVAFSSDGQTLISASKDQTLRIWNLQQPEAAPIILKGHTGHINSVAASSDGRVLASGGQDRTIQLWDAVTGQPIGQPITGHADRVLSVAFNPDGQLLASASEDQTVQLWDLRRPDPVPAMVLQGHELGVRSVAFSHDGQRLASGSKDGTIIIWHVDSTQMLAEKVCQRVWRNLTQTEWEQFIGPDIPYERTCPNLPSGEGAPLNAPAATS